MKYMGILDNLENAWDPEFNFESKPIPETDNMGREKFWEDLGKPENNGLAKNLFEQEVCNNCSCRDEGPWND